MKGEPGRPAGLSPAGQRLPAMLPAVPTTTFDHPPTAGADRSEAWMEGQTYAQFLATAREYPELWRGNYERAVVSDDVRARVTALPGRWHLLVLSADWCIDATSPIPVLARLADGAANLDLRLLDRDAHLALMDEHLTGGTARSIPVVILLDDELEERAWWGPRPAVLQAWFKGEGQLLPSAERYRQSRQWFARDRGRSTLDEVLRIMERAAGVAPPDGLIDDEPAADAA